MQDVPLKLSRRAETHTGRVRESAGEELDAQDPDPDLFFAIREMAGNGRFGWMCHLQKVMKKIGQKASKHASYFFKRPILI